MAVLREFIHLFLSQSVTLQTIESLCLVLLAWRLVSRWCRQLPDRSPPLYQVGDLGSRRFNTNRAEYLTEGINNSPKGQFSFWHGGNHIVVVSGESARTSFQTARGLDPGAGFAALFGSFLDISHLTKDSMRKAMLIYKRCTQTDHLATTLPHIISDSISHMHGLASSRNHHPTDIGPSIIDAQEFLGPLMYQLTHRMSGVHEIASNPTLLRETWNIYRPLEDSPYIDVMLPWLPTPSKLRKVYGYAKLHLTISSIARQRTSEGRREEDMLQMIIDAELGVGMQSLSVIGAVLAGVFNTTFSAVYMLCSLARDEEWLKKVREEIDGVVERQGRVMTTGEGASLKEVLQALSVRDWETRFPVLRAAIAESIRFTMAGSVVRKNISGKDIEVGNTGYVVPNGSLAVHATADTHLDANIYAEPLRWNPDRFMGQKVQGEEVPHGYLGWGSGNHPCPARRFAELNVIVASVVFIATFDFYVCDKPGSRKNAPLPNIIYNRMGAGQLEESVYLACRRRD